MTALAKYLSENGITQKEFGARIGRDQAAVSRLCRGAYSTVSRDLAAKILRETKGQITPELLVGEPVGAAK